MFFRQNFKKKNLSFLKLFIKLNDNKPNILFDHRVIGCGSIKFGQIKKKNTQNCSVVKFVETYFCNPLEAKCDKTAKTFKVDPCYIWEPTIQQSTIGSRTTVITRSPTNFHRKAHRTKINSNLCWRKTPGTIPAGVGAGAGALVRESAR